jgi:hypothetical protein
LRFWIPDRRHSASKPRVNALKAASGMTTSKKSPAEAGLKKHRSSTRYRAGAWLPVLF